MLKCVLYGAYVSMHSRSHMGIANQYLASLFSLSVPRYTALACCCSAERDLSMCNSEKPSR